MSICQQPKFSELEEISPLEFEKLLEFWAGKWPKAKINPLTKNLEVTYLDYRGQFLALVIITSDGEELYYKEI